MKLLIEHCGIVFCAASLAWCQATVSTISDPRPLAKVAEMLERKTGIPVDYEDPEYAYAGDIKDVTDTVARPEFRQEHPDHRVLIPSGGSVDFKLPLNAAPAAQIASAASSLQSVIDQHHARGNPGTFQIRQADQRLQIVPTGVKGQSGRLAASSSVLDTLITVPEREWTGLQIVDQVCQAVTAASGTRVFAGMVPLNLLNQTTVELKADNEPARNVLVRAFAGLARTQGVSMPIPQLSWQLFYAPDAKDYALNIHIVVAETPAPFGTTMQTVVR
jgi:hypothetical protein